MQSSEDLTPEETAMVMKFLPQVKLMAWKRTRHYHKIFDVNDLFQEGVIALIDAVRCFNPAKGANFKTYSEHRIRWAILDAWRSMDTIARRDQLTDEQIDKLDAWFHRHMLTVTAVPQANRDNDEALNAVLFREVSRLVVQVLPPRTQKILTWLYADGWTMYEIGIKLRISESQVSYIHKDALVLLRHHLSA